MKLVAAKCPSCGASLEVDSKEEIVTCKYCKSKIIVDDAIAKYKLELTGKVKVSGIKDNEDRLSDAKKHLKLKEYPEAYALLNYVIETEPFNIEAYILRLKAYVAQFQEIYEDDEDFETDCDLNETFWQDVDIILDCYDRICSIDEKKNYKKKLKDELKFIEKLEKEKEKLAKDLEICNNIDEIIAEITSYKFNDEISKLVKRNYYKINKVLTKYFTEKLGFDVIKIPDNGRCVYRDLTIKYYDSHSKFNTHYIKKYKNLKEIEKVLKDSKDEIKKKILRTARFSSPVGIIKNIMDK